MPLLLVDPSGRDPVASKTPGELSGDPHRGLTCHDELIDPIDRFGNFPFGNRRADIPNRLGPPPADQLVDTRVGNFALGVAKKPELGQLAIDHSADISDTIGHQRGLGYGQLNAVPSGSPSSDPGRERCPLALGCAHQKTFALPKLVEPLVRR